MPSVSGHSYTRLVRAQREQVRAVHPVRSRGEPKQELGLEMVDHPPVAAGGGVMELINHHVVEPVGREPVQVAGECPDAREKHARVRVLLLSVVQAKVRVRPDPAETRPGTGAGSPRGGRRTVRGGTAAERCRTRRATSCPARSPSTTRPRRNLCSRACSRAVSASCCTGRGAGGVARDSDGTPAVCVVGRQR